MNNEIGVSIQEHFTSIPDPRMLLKTRHNLVSIVVMALCGVIAGADNWVEIEDFAKQRKSWFKTFLDLPNDIPSHDTFGRVFSLIDPTAFRQCFINWIKNALGSIASETIAIDGKTARRSHDHANGQKAIHVVSAWAVKHGLILGQVKTHEKSNEITAIPELLKQLDLKGATVTIDAMGCQRDIVEQISKQGGEYVICLKGNQGNLLKETALFFEGGMNTDGKKNPHSTYTSVDGDHGRIETRKYTITDDIDWFEDKSKWKKLRTFGKVDSTREIGEKISQETRYFISSLPMNAELFSQQARGHWAVENSLHWCLDIAFGEDNCRIRKGNAPENLAILRRFSLCLIKKDTARKTGVKASRKRAGWSTSYLDHLLGTI